MTALTSIKYTFRCGPPHWWELSPTRSCMQSSKCGRQTLAHKGSLRTFWTSCAKRCYQVGSKIWLFHEAISASVRFSQIFPCRTGLALLWGCQSPSAFGWTIKCCRGLPPLFPRSAPRFLDSSSAFSAFFMRGCPRTFPEPLSWCWCDLRWPPKGHVDSDGKCTSFEPRTNAKNADY